jgi:hypothetical protein
LFYDKSDFITKINPIQPFRIQGVGGDIKAIGIGKVRLRFHDTNGILHDKVLANAYYAPKSPVCLISIPQLTRDTNENSSLCTGGNKSTLTWDGVNVTVPHPSPLDVPFLNAYLGNPRYNAFYSAVQLLGVGFSATTSNLQHDSECGDHSLHGSDSTIDLNEDITQHVHHMQSLLHAPRENIRQQEYISWHNRLGNLSHAHLQQLVSQGVLPKHFAQCKPPVCPACLFAKQTKWPWRHKGKQEHSLRSFAHLRPGSLTFCDQMYSSTPGLVAQSTGKLMHRRFRAATIFVDSYSDYTYVHLQEDLSSDSTLDAKLAYERKAHTFGVTISGYHADNGRFAERAWRDSCEALNQNISYCGVGAHHQNGVAERHI